MAKDVEAFDKMRKLLEGKTTLMHVPSLVAGKVEALYEGTEDDRWWPPGSGTGIDEPVVVLEGGHSFVLRDGSAFEEVRPAELRVLEALREGFAGVVFVAARTARSDGVEPEKALRLVRAAIEDQARQLRDR